MLTQRCHQFYRDSFGPLMSLSKLTFSPIDHGCWGRRAVPRDAPYRCLPTTQAALFHSQDNGQVPRTLQGLERGPLGTGKNWHNHPSDGQIFSEEDFMSPSLASPHI